MNAAAFAAPLRRVRNAFSFFLTFALLVLPFIVSAHPKTAPATKPAAHQKPISALKVGDIIPARNQATGKVEWKRVTFAAKHTYPFLWQVQTVSNGKTQTVTCPPDQSFHLKGGKVVPASRLMLENCIVTRAGPAVVRGLAQVNKPGGFVVCEVRVGPVPAARLPLFRTPRSLPIQFADYHRPANALYADYVQPFTESMATGTPNPFLFAGQQYDAATGLYYLRARYYAPTTGRFISQDPFAGNDEDPITQNPYVYAGDDPANNIDPGGEDFSIGEVALSSSISETLRNVKSSADLTAYQGVHDTVEGGIANAVYGYISVLMSDYNVVGPDAQSDPALEISDAVTADLFNGPFGVHWTSYADGEQILLSQKIKATSGHTGNLAYFEYAESPGQLKSILQRGGANTGADAQEMAIIFDATGVPIRNSKGGVNTIGDIDLSERGVTYYRPANHGKFLTRIVNSARRNFGRPRVP